ncbi:MAG: mechanosensitive ion channel [Campylobacterales bacterium]|nr:mechanosensitive ion channel [Campylobacterales bacterium]
MDAIKETGEVLIAGSSEVIDQTSRYVEMGVSFAMTYGVKIIGALLIFVIGMWIAKRIQKILVALMKKKKVDDTLQTFLENLVYIVLMIVIVLASLSALGVETTSFIAILGAAGLAIGLALQGTLGNVGSGVILISFRPFKVGDFVAAGGEMGTIGSITLFATTLLTSDNKVITIPNSTIAGGNITNFSAKETRRLNLVFSIGYGDDLKLAKSVLQEIISSDPRVLSEPAPFVGVLELGESSVNFAFRPWVKSKDYWGVHFDMQEKVKLTFDEKGISIPYPQMDVHLRKNED